MKQSFPSRLSWESFYNVMSKGLKVYVFYLTVLSLFRLFFIFWMGEYMAPGTGREDILLALWRGGRLSMQTAGLLTLVSFVPSFLLHYVWPRLERYSWLVLNGMLLTGLSILYVASFPFYRQFRMNFNQMLFNGVNDDIYALFITMIQEYWLPVRLAGAFLLAGCLLYMLKRLFSITLFDFSGIRLPLVIRWCGRIVFLGLLYLISLWTTFGGSLGWQTSVDWENAGVTRDDFLNEAILDNPQAIYRAYNLNSRFLACNGLNFTIEDIRNLAAIRSGMAPDSNNLDTYLLRHAQGKSAATEKPKQVFIILSESLANWPLLDKYKHIPVAEELRGLLKEADTDYCPTFLPNGASTVSAVTGVVTGFADANLYLTTMPESFSAPYPTASAPQLKGLGYETNFWYAGPATWERIGAFTQAQGFEHFYSRGDFGDVPGSVWGCEDEYLYEAILKGMKPEQSQFHVILNASNHSPYDVDVEAKGFDKEKIRQALPAEVQDDEDLIRELGHYWYAQRELVKFIRAIKEKQPDSLILMVGDHGDRYNIDKIPNTYERYGVPFLVTGRGVHKGTLLSDSAGSQIDIVPTLLELIAPKGYDYMAVGSSLTTDNRQGVNYGFWITRNAIGKADTVPLVVEPLDGGTPVSIDDGAMQNYINAIRSISWWRPKYGPVLDEGILAADPNR